MTVYSIDPCPECCDYAQTTCCENPIAKTLTAVIATTGGLGGCACMSVEITLTHETGTISGATAEIWTGEAEDSGCSHPIALRLYCRDDGSETWVLDVSYPDSCGANSVPSGAASVTCDPFTFTQVFEGRTGCGCSLFGGDPRTFSVTITE